ncbi:MAG: mechanosensitive ion channel family protein [Proteobacteria bacterium]|nr:MAG: mechanosensitive ion channel family protein [Pseudomonadota bacterium]
MTDPVSALMDKISSLVDGFFYILPNLGIGLVVFALFVLASWAGQRAISSLLHRGGRHDLGVLLGGFSKWALLLFGVLVVATIVFPSVRPADLFSALGIGSVAIGFAFKDILQNWLSGLLILYRQPFRTGDQISSGPFEGTVEAVEARATLLRTYDGRRVVIPNSDIYTRAVIVHTAYNSSRSEYDVGIGYGDDVEAACRIMVEAMQGVDGIQPVPTPEALPWELAGSAVNVRVRWWTEPRRADVVQVRGRVIATLKNRLSQAGIDLPFPTRVILLHDQTEETDGDRGHQREGWPAGTHASPQPCWRAKAEKRKPNMAAS